MKDSPGVIAPPPLLFVGAIAIGLGLVVFASKRPDAIERTVRVEYQRRVESWLGDWDAVSQTKEWQDITRDNPGMETLARESSDRLRKLPPITARLFPSVLALESLAILALAWGVAIGGAAQLALQVRPLLAIGMLPRPSFAWRDEGVRRVLVAMGPAVIGVSAGTLTRTTRSASPTPVVTSSVRARASTATRWPISRWVSTQRRCRGCPTASSAA